MVLPIKRERNSNPTAARTDICTFPEDEELDVELEDWTGIEPKTLV